MEFSTIKKDMNLDNYLIPDKHLEEFNNIINTMCEYISAWDSDYITMSSSFKKKFGKYKICKIEGLRVVSGE